AYVPIDPAFPKDRIQYMLQQSHADILICSSKKDVEVTFAGYVIDNNDIKDLHASADNPEVSDDLESLASVIFTSGTTGHPKGVMVNQRSIVNFINDIQERAIFTETTDRVMSVTTLSFDIFGFESFAPLCTGHSIYLADEEE